MQACYRKILLCLVFFSANGLFGRDVITINNKTIREEALGGRISVLEDSTGKLSFDSIKNYQFPETSVITANSRNGNTVFWIKFDIKADEDITENIIFEILDFKIDSFELYLPLPEGGFRSYKGGDAYPFSFRNYAHKNFLFNLPFYKKGNYNGYIRVKASEVVGLNFAISSLKFFYHYSITEYLLLALFYGIVIAMAISSLFLYVYLNEKSYLFYSLYVLSLAFYFLTRDGLGFQYIWSDFPIVNSFSKPLSVLMVVVFHVFFVKYYLNIKHYSKLLNKAMYILLISFPLFAYLFDNILGILPDPLIAVIIPFLFLFIFSFRMALKGNVEARFFMAAYVVLFLSFFIFILAYMNIIETNAFVFYSINIASAIEIIIFSLALAGKVKTLIKEKEELKDQANKLLEIKVQERTKELEERNNQLDVFVYKASHDIKGPLKSMIGLTSLALTEIEDPKAKEYFQYMFNTSNRLDSMVEDLLKMGMVKDLEIKRTHVKLNKVIHDIIGTLKHLQGFSRIKININIPEDYMLYTDEALIYSVFQNIIENAIKYQDDSKEE
ncbi:MAG TPA: sensor histidine kinase, partial [Cytophagaceae bacterium]|nr:sensor histidine kinase [Cytophagaceae bacterium]